MQEVIANVDGIKFDIEVAMEQQLGVQPLPFPGMDKSGASVCHFFKQNVCLRGVNCPFRHVLGDKSVVCKHWLRGLCKKGDQCEFLHEYDMSKMPECYFYSKFGRCDNKDCQYQHIDPASKIKDCPWYDRGFCKHGPNCKHRHRRRVICTNYLIGLCPDGPKCTFTHPTWSLPTVEVKGTKCHICGEIGHKANMCRLNPYKTADSNQTDTTSSQNMPLSNGISATPYNGLVIRIPHPTSMKPGMLPSLQIPSSPGPGILGASPGTITSMPNTFMNVPRYRMPLRDFSHITCFKCGQKGHYANRCEASSFSNMPILKQGV